MPRKRLGVCSGNALKHARGACFALQLGAACESFLHRELIRKQLCREQSISSAPLLALSLQPITGLDDELCVSLGTLASPLSSPLLDF